MIRLIYFISGLLQLYVYIIIAQAIMSWLVAFDVINLSNNFARNVWFVLNAITEPALRPIRRFLPNLGGIDISPVILILIILFIQQVVLGNLADALQTGALQTGSDFH
jgi:YggT family protein